MRIKSVLQVRILYGVLISLLMIVVSCVEKNGYYEPAEQTIIDNLTKNKSWERSYHAKLDNGEELDIQERWIFNSNGNGSCKNITTYANGNVEENVTYFHWAFPHLISALFIWTMNCFGK